MSKNARIGRGGVTERSVRVCVLATNCCNERMFVGRAGPSTTPVTCLAGIVPEEELFRQKLRGVTDSSIFFCFLFIALQPRVE